MIAAAALFAVIYVAIGNMWLAALAVGLGALWLVVAEIERLPGAPFFVAFTALAVFAGFGGTLTPLILLGMSVNLAAWDLSRFRSRIAGEDYPDRRAFLEAQHGRVLAATISLGFILALLPLLVHLSIPFVIVCGVVLLTLLALRQAMVSL